MCPPRESLVTMTERERNARSVVVNAQPEIPPPTGGITTIDSSDQPKKKVIKRVVRKRRVSKSYSKQDAEIL